MGHKFTIFKRNCHLNIRRNSFTFRIVDQWNNLPDAIVNTKTVLNFEISLDRMWRNKNLEVLYNPECPIREVTSARSIRYWSTNTTDAQVLSTPTSLNSSYEDLRSEV